MFSAFFNANFDLTESGSVLLPLSAEMSEFPSLMSSLMNLLVRSSSTSWHCSRSLNSGLSRKESLNSSVGRPIGTNSDPAAAGRAIRCPPQTTESRQTRRKSLGSFLGLLFSCLFSSQSFRTRSSQRPWETGLSQSSPRHSDDELYGTSSELCQN